MAICRNGKIVYQGSFGKDGAGNPIARDSPMYLGPSSEILSGALLYSLSLKGSLSLDDDIRRHLPDLDISKPRSLRDIVGLKESDAKMEENPITILQVAAHAADLSERDLRAFQIGRASCRERV